MKIPSNALFEQTAQSHSEGLTFGPQLPANLNPGNSSPASFAAELAANSQENGNNPALPSLAGSTQLTNRADAADPLVNSDELINSKDEPLREAFQDFVGQTFFSQMIKSMRSTQQPSAYFNGGQAEKIFQGQLDQVLSEEISEASAEKIAEPMFELFMLKRQS